VLVDTSGKAYVLSAGTQTVTVYASGQTTVERTIPLLGAGKQPWRMALDAFGDVWVIKRDGYLDAYGTSGAHLEITAQIDRPVSLDINAASILLVGNSNDTVTEYEPSMTGHAVATIPLGAGNWPVSIASDSAGWFYVACYPNWSTGGSGGTVSAHPPYDPKALATIARGIDAPLVVAIGP